MCTLNSHCICGINVSSQLVGSWKHLLLVTYMYNHRAHLCCFVDVSITLGTVLFTNH